MSDGIQQSLPFLSRAARASTPDSFPLAPERLGLHQKVEAIQRLLAYQGRSLSALQVVIAIKDEQIHLLDAYIAALERKVLRLAHRLDALEPPAVSHRKPTSPAGSARS